MAIAVVFIVFVLVVVALVGRFCWTLVRLCYYGNKLSRHAPPFRSAMTDVDRWHQAEVEAGDPTFLAIKDQLLSTYLRDDQGQRGSNRVDLPADEERYDGDGIA